MKQDGYIKYNNISIIKEDAEECIAKVELTKNSLNPYNIAHGGLIFSLGDTVMGFACRALGRKAVTLNASIDFLRPGTGKYLLAKSKIIKVGHQTTVLKATITNDEGTLIATMNSTYFFID